MGKIKHEGYTIEPHYNGWNWTFRAYPTDSGPDDDADFDGESWKYTGNCIYGTTDELNDQINEKTHPRRQA